jgi:hypothetical protein
VVQNGLVLSGHLQQPHQPENSLPIQEFLPQTAGKPQALGSGAKDFQRARSCGSYRRGCAGGDGLDKIVSPLFCRQCAAKQFLIQPNTSFMLKDIFPSIVFFIISWANLGCLIWFYISWFHTESYYNFQVFIYNKLPSWLPYKGFYFSLLSDKPTWMINIKTHSTIMLVGCLFLDIIFFMPN